VRLGSPNVIKLLLSKVDTFDLDARGGFGQNSAFHFAAIRTNFDALYELDTWGADIFNINREGKTCFNLVNNNLLMLKIVKKLEKK
jgi:arginine decarboxylase-like protein